MKRQVILLAMAFCLLATFTVQAQKKKESGAANMLYSNAEFMAFIAKTKELGYEEKEESGKKQFILKPGKGLLKSKKLAVFELDADLSKQAQKDVYRYKEGDASFSFNNGEKPDSRDYLIKLNEGVWSFVKSDGAKLHFTLANSKELLAEWTDDKAQKVAKDIIDTAEASKKEALAKEEYEKCKTNYMPKPGKLHTDALAKEAFAAFRKRFDRDGGTALRTVIVSDDWIITRNKVTGIILKRSLYGVTAETHPKGFKGLARMHFVTFSQNHNGSDFSGELYADGITQWYGSADPANFFVFKSCYIPVEKVGQ